MPPSVRHYRSLLDVEDAPKLPVAKPLSYAELYPSAPEPVPVRKASLPPQLDSQPPRLPDTGHSIIIKSTTR